MRNKFLVYAVLLGFVFSLTGCAVIFQKGRRSDLERISQLESELEKMKNTKGLLEQQLAQEIEDKQVKLSMQEKGLVITFVSEVLFDSGKAQLKEQSLHSLAKVAKILNENVANHNIGIEGHTDNQPIKHSHWKSNWELSAHRALSVLGYLETQGVESQRLSASGYGQYQPVASNDTAAGRQENRRVEIVILPLNLKKVTKDQVAEPVSVEPQSQEEELK